MKSILTLVATICTFGQLLFACSCVGNSFCSNIEKFTDSDNDLVFMGTFIQSEEMIGIFTPMQVKVEKIFFGEIVTPDSPLYEGEQLVNTDTTIWILAGNSSICMPDILDQSAVFAVSYNQSIIFDTAASGYLTHVCDICYLPVSVNGIISGWITEAFQEEQMTMEEFENFFSTGCLTSSDNLQTIEEDIVAYPQPTTGSLNLSLPGDINDWDLNLYDISGNQITVLPNSSIDLSYLKPGIYILVIEKNRQRFTKRIVKI